MGSDSADREAVVALFGGLLSDLRRIKDDLVVIINLQEIVKENFKTMSETGEKVKADLAGAKADVEEIKGDLQELLDKIAGFAGLPTVEEWAEIQTMAADIKAGTRQAADTVPEPEPEPEPEA
jgi:hypothetical protein